tara:strand:+ start:76386 stop:77933 length:1548 start_codon:yes stop_codon:yes gene_type:complete
MEMHKIKISHSPLLATFIVSLSASLLIVFLATNGSFDLFQPSFLWKAYNHYFLSLIDGRLDVPAYAIGKEGNFIDGKAYMYYGLLPTVTRLFIFPFADLTQVPVAYFSVLFFTIIGNSVLQYSLISKHVAMQLAPTAGAQQTPSLSLLILISSVIWIGSGSFIISQNATIYHEPYAASLCMVNLFLALLVKHDFFIGAYRKVNLVPFAILAGLCIHARMPSALALYLVTGLLILVQTYRSQVCLSKIIKIHKLLGLALVQYWKAILILGLFGLSILWLNYAKYGDALSFMGRNYGFMFFEGFSERMCNVLPQAEFYKFYRILVNTYVYLSGDWQNHWSLIRLFSTGYGRVELPAASLALLWALPLITFIFLFFVFIKGFIQVENRILLLALLGFSAGATFQLMYPTITHRYVVTFWPPLLASILFCWFKYGSSISLKTKYIVITLGFVGMTYQLYLAVFDDYYVNDGPVTALELPTLHYSDEDSAYLGALTKDKIKTFKIERSRIKRSECEKWLN